MTASTPPTVQSADFCLLEPRTFDPPPRILVLDDQSVIRSLFEEVLRSSNYEVRPAANLEEAGRLLATDRFDAAVVDIFLQDQESGLALLPRIRELQPNTPAIVISGMASMDHVIEALKAGAYDMLCKPLNVLDMLRVVERAVEKKRMADENDRLVEALRRERDLLEQRVCEATHDLEATIDTLRLLNEQMATMFEMSQTPLGMLSGEHVIRRIFELLQRLIDFEDAFCVVYDVNAHDLHLSYAQGEGARALCEGMGKMFRHEGEVIHAICHPDDRLLTGRFIEEIWRRYPGERPSADVMLMPLNVAQTLSGVVGLIRKSGSTRLSHIEERMIGMAISQLLAAIEQRNFVMRTGQLASLGELISEIAHDLRHPMTAMRGASRMLQTHYEDPVRRGRCLHEIQGNLGRMESLVSELVNFYNPREMNMVPVDLHELLDKAIEVTWSLLEQQKIEVRRMFDPKPLIVLGLTRNLVEAFINLISNASHAMGEGGRLELSTARTLAPEHVDLLVKAGCQPDNYVTAIVRDNGCGIPEENIKRIFGRFFTTPPDGKGHGLSALKRIVRKILGLIHVESRVGEGSTFYVFLPKA